MVFSVQFTVFGSLFHEIEDRNGVYYSNCKRELKMGTGSEREHGIFSEKTPPLGACPLFQREREIISWKLDLPAISGYLIYSTL